jgi:hypothetical protein
MKMSRTIGLVSALLIFIFAPLGGNCSERRPSLKLLDINVWSGLDYKGYLNMGEYETPEVREKRFQALVTQIIAIRITYQNKPVYVFATHWHASLSDSPEILKAAQKHFDSGAVSHEAYHQTLSEIKAGVAWRMSESNQTVSSWIR